MAMVLSDDKQLVLIWVEMRQGYRKSLPPWRGVVPYLKGGHPKLLANQDLPPLQLGDPGLLHLHEVIYQLRDVHLPVRAQQVGQVCPRLSCLGHKLSQDSHHGMLVLKSAAPAPSLVFVLFLTVPSWPVKGSVQFTRC